MRPEIDRKPNARNLIVNYLPRNIDEDMLRVLFEEHGPVEHTKIIREKDTGRSKTFGFVTFLDCESAADAIRAKNGFSIGSKQLKVAIARLPTDKIENRKLVVKGLPVFYTEGDALELFSKFGEVIECRLLRGRTEISRGQCFVSYVTSEECMRALKTLPNIIFQSGNRLTVELFNKDHYNEQQHRRHDLHLLPQYGVNSTISGRSLAYPPTMAYLDGASYHQSFAPPTPDHWSRYSRVPSMPCSGDIVRGVYRSDQDHGMYRNYGTESFQPMRLPKSSLVMKNVPEECNLKDACILLSQYGTVTKIVKHPRVVYGDCETASKLELTIWPTEKGIQQLAAFDKQKLVLSDGISVKVESFNTCLVETCIAVGNAYAEL